MAPILWSSQFELGHPQLDSEHRRLVDLINAAYAAANAAERAKANSLLDEFYSFTERHFRNENRILSAINGGPVPTDVERLSFIRAMITAAVDRHIANHATELPRLRSIIRDMRGHLEATEPHFNPDLAEWFIEHVTTYDSHLRPVFAALRQADSPASGAPRPKSSP